MTQAAEIKEHMEVVGSDGDHVGRVDHVVGDNFSLGLESSGELSGEAKGRHWLGPVFSASSEESNFVPSFELSVFAPLTRKTPDVQFRLELDWEF